VSWPGEETSSGMSRFRSYSLNACGSLSSGFFDCHMKFMPYVPKPCFFHVHVPSAYRPLT
jgi:hypothetical protein